METAVDVAQTPRVMQVSSMFDVPPGERAERVWDAELPIEQRDWHVGLIVGPSGAGKSRLAREIWGSAKVDWQPDWSDRAALIDQFPAELGIRDIIGLLTGVGLSSAPSWLRPWGTLSTGEQFRANLALRMASEPDPIVVDEFTSTVDRQVAKVASAALAKRVRARGSQVVAVTCHYDIEKWLQPDWTYQPHLGEFRWRSVQPRPAIKLDIYPVDKAIWTAFRQHHYLSGRLIGSDCWGGFVGDECVAFAAVGHYPHPSPKSHDIRRIRRQVVLPDWQGLGIGTRMEDWLAQHYSERGYRFRSVTAHPGMNRHYAASPRWKRDGQNRSNVQTGRNAKMAAHRQEARSFLLQSWQYMPLPRGQYPC